MFIELQHQNGGRKLFINVDHIIAIEPRGRDMTGKILQGTNVLTSALNDKGASIRLIVDISYEDLVSQLQLRS